MKNQRIPVPIIIPADLRLEEFAPYFSALAAWVLKNPNSLESLFCEFRDDTKAADTPAARMEFTSRLFFECKAGSDFLATLQRTRLRHPTLAATS